MSTLIQILRVRGAEDRGYNVVLDLDRGSYRITREGQDTTIHTKVEITEVIFFEGGGEVLGIALDEDQSAVEVQNSGSTLRLVTAVAIADFCIEWEWDIDKSVQSNSLKPRWHCIRLPRYADDPTNKNLHNPFHLRSSLSEIITALNPNADPNLRGRNHRKFIPSIIRTLTDPSRSAPSAEWVEVLGGSKPPIFKLGFLTSCQLPANGFEPGCFLKLSFPFGLIKNHDAKLIIGERPASTLVSIPVNCYDRGKLSDSGHYIVEWTLANRDSEPHRVCIGPLSPAAVSTLWNDLVASSVLDPLESIRGDRPASFLPRLPAQAFQGGTRWSVAIEYYKGRATITRIMPEELNGTKPDGRVTFPSITTTHGVALEHDFRFVLQSPPHVADLEGECDANYVFPILTLEPVSDSGSSLIRFGALELEIGSDSNAITDSPAALQAKPIPSLVVTRRKDSNRARSVHWDIKLNLKLPVRRVSPASQDTSEIADLYPEVDAPAPLIVALGAHHTDQLGTLRLRITEEVIERKRHQFALTLAFEGEAKKGILGGSVAIVDPSPLFIARVDLPELRPTEEAADLARYSSDSTEGASWDVLAQPGQAFDIVLPPQAMGEAMVKLYAEATPEDVKEGDPIDFRFGPPSVLRILTGWRSELRRYVEIPSNLRRIFGDFGQRAPGALVRQIDTEILYGLHTRISRRDDLQLSELTADLGAPPRSLPKASVNASDAARVDRRDSTPVTKCGDLRQIAYEEHCRRWGEILEAFRHRLMVLSLHVRGFPGLRTLDTGLEFALRREAEIRGPVPGAAIVIPNQLPGPALRIRDPRDPNLLPGGADWGIESRKLYEDLWKNPISQEGGISDLHFSALGAWGSQRAVFDNGLTAITCHVVMGRTAFYSLKRLGRIGCLWNRAEHVIVYERTVAPAPQYAPVQKPHLERALLRKVAEYVEILQESRSYPEGLEALKYRGFVLGSRFRSLRIAVDGSAGRDLGEEGWTIPLWSPSAEPTIYPRPHCDLRLSVREESGDREVYGEITNPDVLQFFTLTNSSRSRDTDSWPAVEGVDYLDLEHPGPPAFDTHDQGNPDLSLPSESSVPPGHSRLTMYLRLPDGAKIHVAKERQGAALDIALQNVTLSRGSPVGGSGNPSVAGLREVRAKLDELLTSATKSLEEIRARASVAAQSAVNGIDQLRSELTQSLGELQETVRSKTAEVKKMAAYKDFLNADACEFLKGQVKANLSKARERIDFELKALRDGLFRDIALISYDNPDSFRQCVLRLLAGAEGEILVVATRLSDGLEKLRSVLPAGKAPFRVLWTAMKPVFEEAERRLNELHAESALKEFMRSFGQGILDRLDSAIVALSQALAVGAPASALRVRSSVQEPRRKIALEIAKQINTITDSPAEDLREAISSALVALKVALEGVCEAPDNQIDEAIGLISELIEIAPVEAGKVGEELTEAVRELRRLITDPRSTIKEIMSHVIAFVDKVVSTAKTRSELAQGSIVEFVGENCQALFGSAAKSIQRITCLVASIRRNVQSESAITCRHFVEILNAGASQVDQHLKALDQGVQDFLRRRVRELGVGAAAQVASGALSLVRAFGPAPLVPGLAFNRDRVGYYFDRASERIKTTPMAALFDRAGGQLKALGLRLPTLEISDRLVPMLKNLDLCTLFPDFGGIKLDQLIPGFRVQSTMSDRIRITHGIERESRRAFADIHVDALPVGSQVSLFSIAGAGITLTGGRFTAKVRADTDLDGRIQREVFGRIDGDWELRFAGEVFVTFENTPLIYSEQSGLKFALDPSRVRLGPRLDILTSLLSGIGGDRSGLRISPIFEGNLPAGIRSELTLALPPLQAGTFAITGLAFSAGMELRFLPQFTISTFFGLGSKRDPFTITVFVLGGGGWLESRASYSPASGAIAGAVSIGIGASAMIGINIVVARGSVRLFFGINAELEIGGGNRRIGIAIILLAEGTVTVIGLITVSLTLLLEVEIKNGTVIGRGSVSFTIKLFFFKKTVRAAVTYHLRGNSNGQQMSSVFLRDETEYYLEAAKLYLKSLN